MLQYQSCICSNHQFSHNFYVVLNIENLIISRANFHFEILLCSINQSTNQSNSFENEKYHLYIKDSHKISKMRSFTNDIAF